MGQDQILFEFGHDLVYLVVRVATSTGSVYRFSAIATGSSIFVEVWILGGTSAFEFAIFKENKPHRHQNEE
jgi:hypothetical protein